MSDDAGDKPTVLISNRQSRAVDEPALALLAAECLLGEGMGDAELSISFVERGEMAALHAKYAKEEGPTDVLAFPLGAGDEGGRRVLGDVVIAPEVAEANNPDLGSELRLLLVHGILHLLGYDHERSRERAEMWARQERYSGVRA